VSVRRRSLLAVAALALVLVAACAYLVLRSGHSTPVAERTAIARYRSLQGSAPATGDPAPGVYAYDVHGWECAGVGPLCLHRTLPSTAYAIVIRHGSSLTIEIDLSREHVEAERLTLTARGRLLAWERARISILGVTRDDAHAISPPTTLAVPAAPRAGMRWTQAFDDGGLPVSVVNRITGRTSIRVDGTPRTAWVITSASRTGGAHPGTERDSDWQDVTTGLDLRMTIDRRITGVFPYRLELTGQLRSTEPAR
jgi:hypothetical protein